MMRGAVEYEQGNHEQALGTYKLAETVLEELDAYEELGLINSRIGELYQMSFVNDSAAIDRAGKALRYFKLSQNKKYIASSSLDYASTILLDSVNVAAKYILEGLDIARDLNDTTLICSSYELLIHIKNMNKDYHALIELANDFLLKYHLKSSNILSYDVYNDFYIRLFQSYLNIGMLEEAQKNLSKLNISTRTDSLLYYHCKEKIAIAGGEWQDAYRLYKRLDYIYDSTMISNYDKQLVEVERKYDVSRMKEDYHKKRNENLSVMLVLLLMLLVVSVCALIIRNKLRDRERELIEFSDRLSLTEKELRGKVENQRKGNIALQKLSGELMGIINEIGYTFDIYRDSPNPTRLVENIKRQIDDNLSMRGFEDKAKRIVDILYPGMLQDLFSMAHPQLSEEDKWIIILMCCRFETNTICVCTDNTASKLNNKKSRIAKKLNSSERLSIFLEKHMKEYGG